MSKRTNRRPGPLRKAAALRCGHDSLKLTEIDVAERCPTCFWFITRDGAMFKNVVELTKSREAAA